MKSTDVTALSEAMVVTFLWSTSYIVIKTGLQSIPPLIFAGTRYLIGFLGLLVASFTARVIQRPSSLREWGEVVALGLSGYTFMAGFQFLGLVHLDVVDSAFIANLNPIFVAMISIAFLKIRPRWQQWMGMAICLVGARIYFPVSLSRNKILGIVFTLLSGLSWGVYMNLAREMSKRKTLGALNQTMLSMAFGSCGLMVAAISLEAVPIFRAQAWIFVLALGLINTALAFTLWNHALERLGAFETSVLQNTMLVQISILSLVFLGEEITPTKAVAMALVLLGVFLVQRYSRRAGGRFLENGPEQ